VWPGWSSSTFWKAMFASSGWLHFSYKMPKLYQISHKSGFKVDALIMASNDSVYLPYKNSKIANEVQKIASVGDFCLAEWKQSCASLYLFRTRKHLPRM